MAGNIGLNLATCLTLLGRYDEAIEFWEEMTRQSVEYRGEADPETLSRRVLLAKFYLRAARNQDAVDVLETVKQYDIPQGRTVITDDVDLLLMGARAHVRIEGFSKHLPTLLGTHLSKIEFTLPASQAELVKSLAKQQGMSSEEWLRKAIKAYAETNKGEPESDD